MRRLCLIASAAALGLTLGCGDATRPTVMNDALEQEIREENKRVAEEEGGKPQPKGKAGKR